MSTKYVYKDIEVVLTNRTAVKQLRTKKDVLYEIKPADPDQGNWRKWVRKTDLHEIIEAKGDDEPLH